MRTIERLRRDLTRCKTIWDVIRYCKRSLNNTVPNETNFLATYCHNGTSASYNNPNLDHLDELAVNVSKCLGHLARCRHDILDAALEEFDQAQLVPFGETELNRATIPWHVILGIDRSLQQTGLTERLASRGPFNDPEEDGFGIYLSSKGLPLSNWREAFELKPIPEYHYNDDLQANLLEGEAAVEADAYEIDEAMAKTADINRKVQTMTDSTEKFESLYGYAREAIDRQPHKRQVQGVEDPRSPINRLSPEERESSHSR